jgi:hypothetical protein
VRRVFDELLDRYRFTTRDTAADASENGVEAAIDPEMLGRVFEGVMSTARRETTGTFYTPARVADRLVREALIPALAVRLDMGREAARRLIERPSALDAEQRGRVAGVIGSLRILDPACGSGAFLLAKIKYFTHENAGYGDVHLPEMQMHTTSFWLTLPEPLVESFGVPRASVIEGLRGAGLALETVASLALMCEPRDINRTLGDGYDSAPLATAAGVSEPGAAPARSLPGRGLPGRNASQRGGNEPTLFLFDAIAGGVGLAKRIYQRAPELVRRAEELIQSCHCKGGCPACIGPHDPGAGGGIPKALSCRILRACR